ncbi:MAG: V-type ATPase subunit, partial [Nitrososphaeraceae archaeon]
GKSYEELVPKVNLRAEELLGRRDIIVKALVSKNLDEAIGALAGSDVAEDAAKAAAIYKDKLDLRVFDTYLDRTFFIHLGRGMNAESQSLDVKNIVSTDIDSYNILAVLRGKFWGLAPNDISDLVVTTTSKVTRDTLMKMINTEKISEAIGELGNTVYKEIIPQTFTSDIDAIMQLENGFEAMELKRVVSAFRSMFNLGIMVAALKLLMIEVRNLSAIASGVEQKVPTEAIVSRLIIPT